MAHRRSLGFPRFPVEGCGFDHVHVVLFERTTYLVVSKCGEAGNLGTLGMTNRRGWLWGKGGCWTET